MNANLRFYVHLVDGGKDGPTDGEVFDSLGIPASSPTLVSRLCEDGVTRDLYTISFRELMTIEEAGCVAAGKQCVLFEDAGAGTPITVYQNPSSGTPEILGATYTPVYASKAATSATYIVVVNSLHRPTLEHFASQHNLTIQRMNVNGNEHKHMTVSCTEKQRCIDFSRDRGIPNEERKYFRYYIKKGSNDPRECTPTFEPKEKKQKRLHPESTSAEAP